jgi:aerobic-type carbon monoxide dehydrogenase small subunit (CoxS/CutS family)
MRIGVEVNGRRYEAEVEPRTLLSDFIRHDCALTGTHVGCEHGVCGACTVQLDGEPIRSCLMLAVQADGRSLTTVEGLEWGELHEAFRERHALQCGFCTAGFLMSAQPLLALDLGEEELREALAGNLCRCTGYTAIIDAVRDAGRHSSTREDHDA